MGISPLLLLSNKESLGCLVLHWDSCIAIAKVTRNRYRIGELQKRAIVSLGSVRSLAGSSGDHGSESRRGF